MGSLGALPWARRTASPLVAAVGRERVDLGIEGYGYLWRSDHRSYTRRVGLAHDLGLHGVAVWRLASADPLRG